MTRLAALLAAPLVVPLVGALGACSAAESAVSSASSSVQQAAEQKAQELAVRAFRSQVCSVTADGKVSAAAACWIRPPASASPRRYNSTKTRACLRKLSPNAEKA